MVMCVDRLEILLARATLNPYKGQGAVDWPEMYVVSGNKLRHFDAKDLPCLQCNVLDDARWEHVEILSS